MAALLTDTVNMTDTAIEKTDDLSVQLAASMRCDDP